jgi:hypothetical protein
MAGEIFFQNVIFSKFILPFLLIFFIVFAILEKTKVLGEHKQVNALVAFVIGLIFVGVAFPKEVVENMILFLTVALVVVFVVMILWGFLVGGEVKIDGLGTGVKWATGLFILFVVFAALLWATGFDAGLIGTLFYQPWSNTFWTNAIFIVLIGAALALVIKTSNSG